MSIDGKRVKNALEIWPRRRAGRYPSPCAAFHSSNFRRRHASRLSLHDPRRQVRLLPSSILW